MVRQPRWFALQPASTPIIAAIALVAAALSFSASASAPEEALSAAREMLEAGRDAQKPWQAAGTERESYYRCADYNPLERGQKNIAEFRCLDGFCIKVGNVCNGLPNCADGSDEFGCPTTTLHSFDCDSDDFDEFVTAWPVAKKVWCCRHHGKGCPMIQTTTTATTTMTSVTSLTLTTQTGTTTSVTTTSVTTTLTSKTGTTLTATSISTSTSVSNTSSTSSMTSLSSSSTTSLTTTTRTTTTSVTTRTGTSSTSTRSSITLTNTSSTQTTSVTTETSTRTISTTVTTTSATTSTTTISTSTTSTLSTLTLTTSTVTTTTSTQTTTTLTSTTTTATTSTATTTTATSTTTTIDPVTATMMCAKKDTAYYPLDMAGHSLRQVSDVAKCQARCAKTAGCAHYTFWSPLKHCHLQDAKSHPVDKQILFTSGPPECSPQEDVRSIPESWDPLGDPDALNRKFGTAGLNNIHHTLGISFKRNKFSFAAWIGVGLPLFLVSSGFIALAKHRLDRSVMLGRHLRSSLGIVERSDRDSEVAADSHDSDRELRPTLPLLQSREFMSNQESRDRMLWTSYDCPSL